MNEHQQTRARWGTPSVWRSLGHALAGLRAAARTERNLRVHGVAALLVAGAAGWLEVSLLGWAVLALTIGVVVCAELFNSAIERIVDLVQPDYHPLAGEIKDVSAAAVVVCAGTAVVVAVCVLGPALLHKVGI